MMESVIQPSQEEQKHEANNETQQLHQTQANGTDEILFFSKPTDQVLMILYGLLSGGDGAVPSPLCAPSSTLSFSSYSSSTVTFPEGMKEVYQNGILPYMMDHWFPGTSNSSEETKEQKQPNFSSRFKQQKQQQKSKKANTNQWWNGYLPLAPAEKPTTDENHYRCRRRRQCTNHGSYYYSIGYPQDLRPQDYASRQITLPTNYHHNDEWEIIFYDEQQNDTRTIQTRVDKNNDETIQNLHEGKHYDHHHHHHYHHHHHVGGMDIGGSTKSSQLKEFGRCIGNYYQKLNHDDTSISPTTIFSDWSEIPDLPNLLDAPSPNWEALLKLKLKLSTVLFRFDDDCDTQKAGREMKRNILLELCHYMSTMPMEQKVYLCRNENIVTDFMAMVRTNVCRVLPHSPSRYATFTTITTKTTTGKNNKTIPNDEENEIVVMLEPAWPHLQIVYELFLQYLNIVSLRSSNDRSILQMAKTHISESLVYQLIELLTTSDDPRERDYLKIILHRIYGKFVFYRSGIRRFISTVICKFLYEKESEEDTAPIKIQVNPVMVQYYHSNKSYVGIGELLEIMGSVIHGFTLPLKEEHERFLVRVLIPLHKSKHYKHYHQQLSYCILKYMEKDSAVPILNGLFRYWPWCSSTKQVMFLNELEKILEVIRVSVLTTTTYQLTDVNNSRANLLTIIFTNLARCLHSDHFQVVERALFLWNNETLVRNDDKDKKHPEDKNGQSLLLSKSNASIILPIIYRPLYKHSIGFTRNPTIVSLAQNVLKMYEENDRALYNKCTCVYQTEEEEKCKKLEVVESLWNNFETMAATTRESSLSNDG